MAAKSTAKTTAAAKTVKNVPVNVMADPVKSTVADTKTKEAAASASKKAPAKKAPAKRTTAKKEIKVSTFVEYMGKQVGEKDMIAAVKKAWTKSAGKKVADIKSIDLYIKPEDGMVYYVVNGTDTGSVVYE